MNHCSLIDKSPSDVQGNTPVTSSPPQSNTYQSSVGYQAPSSYPQSSYPTSQDSSAGPSSKKSDGPVFDSKLCSAFLHFSGLTSRINTILTIKQHDNQQCFHLLISRNEQYTRLSRMFPRFSDLSRSRVPRRHQTTLNSRMRH